jgi:hypothetical protein
MRIQTTGDDDWRTDLYDETAESFNVGTKVSPKYINSFIQP